MPSCKNGVQKHLRDKCLTAMYVHYISHCLNLCLMKVGPVTGIKKTVTQMNKISVFYHDSSERTRNLQVAIQQKRKKSLRIHLKQLCVTPWVEKQEAVRVFKHLLPAVFALLDDMLLLLITRTLPRDGGMAKDHGAPVAGQLPRAWIIGCRETGSCHKVTGAKSS